VPRHYIAMERVLQRPAIGRFRDRFSTFWRFLRKTIS